MNFCKFTTELYNWLIFLQKISQDMLILGWLLKAKCYEGYQIAHGEPCCLIVGGSGCTQ